MPNKIKWINDNEDFIPFIEIEEIGYNENESISLQNKSADEAVLSNPIMPNRNMEEMTIGTVQKTEQSLRLLIQATQEIKSSLIRSGIINNTDKKLLNEFSTVKFKGARSSGHSVSAVRAALAEFPDTNILYLTNTITNARKTRDNVLRSFDDTVELDRVFFSSYESKGNRGRSYGCIIVDLPFLISRNNKQEIESLAIVMLNADPRFILVEVG